MTTTEKNPNLVKAKLAVMSQVGYVQKQGKMQGGGSYTYAKEGDFIAAIRPEMIAAGLAFSPVSCELLDKTEIPRDKGGFTFRVVVKRTFRLSHESGEFEDIVTVGEGMDVGDKACNKAMTAAKKYALREAFLIETGDDPDDTPSQALAAGCAAKPHDSPKTDARQNTDPYEPTDAEIAAASANGEAFKAAVKACGVPWATIVADLNREFKMNHDPKAPVTVAAHIRHIVRNCLYETKRRATAPTK